jgi:alkylhydroperoxidase/carboxymuconolactone decarboxylase family protein YurZ
METMVSKLDPVFAEMSAATDHNVWAEIPELTAREKVLLCVVADVCQQTLGLPFELHVTMGREHGVDADDLREMLRFISYDSGYPAALAALERLTAIEHEHGLPGPTGQRHEVNADGTGSPIPRRYAAPCTASTAISAATWTCSPVCGPAWNASAFASARSRRSPSTSSTRRWTRASACT